MVLWEITLGTAYFLGLKRTYRLALKLQRRLISPKRSRIRIFAQQRTRAIFDVALKVHQNIQERDIEVGRNLGNWILRWLDRMKPSAQIRGSSPGNSPSSGITNMKMTKQAPNSSHLKAPGRSQTSRNGETDRHLFTSTTITMMMRQPRPSGTITQYRHLGISRARFEGVLRQDIAHFINKN